MTAPLREQYRPHGSRVARDHLGRKQCKRCEEWKPVADFRPHSHEPDGLSARCYPCVLEVNRWQKYKVDQERFEAMLAEQGGGCAICGSPTPRWTGYWHIDHDHACCDRDGSCGKCVRGVLCQPCNVGLGHLGDDPKIVKAALEYLERWANAGRV